MLVTRTAAGRAYSVPILYLVVGTAIGTLSMGALLQASGAGQIWGGLIGVLLGGGSVVLGIGSCRLLRAGGDELVVSGLGKRVSLERTAAAFGVRLQSGGRSSRWIVFVTDGQSSDELGDWFSEQGARRAITRLERALLPPADPHHRPLARAKRQVAAIEREWQAPLAEAQKTVQAYYDSPAWRRAKYGVVGLVIAYSIGMMIYLALTER